MAVKINDWGTSVTTPEDYLDRLAAFGLFTSDGSTDGSLTPVPPDEVDTIMKAVRSAQSQHYRNVAAMDRDQKIACGAYVYFSFLRPFAEVAGVADDIDWTVPRDTVGNLYDALSTIDGGNQSTITEDEYYSPIP